MPAPAFRDTSAALTAQDIDAVAGQVGVDFPAGVAQHYLRDNGGIFAVGWGGNFVCFDAAEYIYSCTTDGWSDELTPAENRANFRRRIADSLYAFLEALGPEP